MKATQTQLEVEIETWTLREAEDVLLNARDDEAALKKRLANEEELARTATEGVASDPTGNWALENLVERQNRATALRAALQQNAKEIQEAQTRLDGVKASIARNEIVDKCAKLARANSEEWAKMVAAFERGCAALDMALNECLVSLQTIESQRAEFVALQGETDTSVFPDILAKGVDTTTIKRPIFAGVTAHFDTTETFIFPDVPRRAAVAALLNGAMQTAVLSSTPKPSYRGRVVRDDDDTDEVTTGEKDAVFNGVKYVNAPPLAAKSKLPQPN